MITKTEVNTIVNSDINPKILQAREMSSKLKLHVEGVGLQEYLSKINNYENEGQFEARKKHAISNKFITEELLRPVDNAFHARGGSKDYLFKNSEDKNKEILIGALVDVKGNQSLSEYIEQEWFHKYITDPNGLIFMEIDGEDEEAKIQPTYKSIFCIRDYEQNGMFVDWVVFEPHLIYIDEENPKDETKHKKTFWVVDETYYYLYEQSNEGIKLIDEKENSFGKVPAILCSNIVDNVTGWKKSAIDAQVELLDKYLVSNSVLSISEFFHNYIQQWTYVADCNKCDGSGIMKVQEREMYVEKECDKCNGSGKSSRKDVTDIIELQIPQKDEVKIDPPSGFIYAPVDGWKGMIDSVDRTWDIMYFSHWGTTISRDGKNETATGRFLDAQPVNNRLNKYTKSIEIAHTGIVNFIGKFMFPETFDKAVIQYGRRYLIETPDQIWEKYLNAKKENAPISTLDLLLMQFIESEFRENEKMFIYETKKAKLEPFVHWDVITVQKLNVATIEYNKKLYFSDWIKTKEIRDIITEDIEKLNQELTDFANERSQNNNYNGQVQ